MREALAAKKRKKKGWPSFPPMLSLLTGFPWAAEGCSELPPKEQFQNLYGRRQIAQNKNPACEEAMGLGGVGGL